MAFAAGSAGEKGRGAGWRGCAGLGWGRGGVECGCQLGFGGRGTGDGGGVGGLADGLLVEGFRCLFLEWGWVVRWWVSSRCDLALVATSRRGGGFVVTLEVSGTDAFLDGGLFT